MTRRQNALRLTPLCVALAALAAAGCQIVPRLAPAAPALAKPNASALLDHPAAATRPA